MKRSIDFLDPRPIALILGMLIGRLLAYAIANARHGLRIALVVLGAVLLAGPILFWDGPVSAKVIYGLGIYAGILSEHIARSRKSEPS